MGKKIITISRQYGSGGTEIGRELSERLGIPYYDQAILSKLASKTEYEKDILSDNNESLKNGRWLYGLSEQHRFEESPQDMVWKETVKLIQNIAAKGPCILIGRCAEYILKDDYDLLPIFIHSNIDDRMRRAVTIYGLSPDKLEKTLRDNDRLRAAYYQLHTDYTWGDVTNYTICLDSGTLGIETCVDIIADLYLSRR